MKQEYDRYVTLARALAMAGIQASPKAVELIEGVIKLSDKLGQKISLADINELAEAIQLRIENEEAAQAKKGNDK